MIKQTLFFATPVCLSLKNNQIVISWKDSDDKVTRPIEDIGCVVIENQMIAITIPLLNHLVKNNVAVIVCDDKQMPTSMLMGLDTNTTQAETLRTQIGVGEPCKKQVWQQIIKAKITNQSMLLKRLNKDYTPLKPLIAGVKSGDTDNREGLAAKIYWNRLLGGDFKRERDGRPPNAMLNYGYSILRAATARALLGSGLLPNIGVFHRNRYNAFPLADDVMEAYRPFVDEVVYNLHSKQFCDLTKDVKMEILKVLTCDVKVNNVMRPLQIALTLTTASLARYFAGQAKKLSLPTFV